MSQLRKLRRHAKRLPHQHPWYDLETSKIGPGFRHSADFVFLDESQFGGREDLQWRTERAVKLWRFWNRKALGSLAPNAETDDLHFGTSAGPTVQGNARGTNEVQK